MILSRHPAPRTRPPLRTVSLLVLALSLSGCMSSLHKQSLQLASATTPVVEQAASVYQAANLLHDDASDAQAVRDFNRATPVYNPRNTAVLIPDEDIAVRLRVLQSFQLYVQTVVDILHGTSSPALDAAATSVGGKLTSLSNDVAPAIEKTAGVAGVDKPITPAMRNGISTAANALGQFLVYRTIKRRLPAIVVQMDGHLKVLCELLESDIDTLQDQEKRDIDTLIDFQTLALRTSPSPDPAEQRAEIMKLPAIVRRGRASQAQLTQFRTSIVTLYETHHALAAELKGNDPESLKKKIAELAAAGSNLGTFYSSLPTN